LTRSCAVAPLSSWYVSGNRNPSRLLGAVAGLPCRKSYCHAGSLAAARYWSAVPRPAWAALPAISFIVVPSASVTLTCCTLASPSAATIWDIVMFLSSVKSPASRRAFLSP